VAGWFLSRFGWAGLACFKAACVALVLGLAAAVSRKRPAAAGRLLYLGCACLAAVVLYSGALGVQVSHAAESTDAEVSREMEAVNRQIRAENAHVDPFRVLLDELRRDVLTGGKRLDEAAAILEASKSGRHPYWVKMVTAVHAAPTRRQSFAYYLLRAAAQSQDVPASFAWTATLRLEHEFERAYGAAPPLDHRPSTWNQPRGADSPVMAKARRRFRRAD
jgi:hypothetical protein